MKKKKKFIIACAVILTLILTFLTVKIIYPRIRYDRYDAGYNIISGHIYEYAYLIHNEEKYIRCDQNENFYERFEIGKPIGYSYEDLLSTLLANCKVYSVVNDSDNNVVFIYAIIGHGFYFMKEGISFDDVFKSSNITWPDKVEFIATHKIEDSETEYNAAGDKVSDKERISQFHSRLISLYGGDKSNSMENLKRIKELSVYFSDCYVSQELNLMTDGSNYYLAVNNPFNECEAVYMLNESDSEFFLNF